MEPEKIKKIKEALTAAGMGELLLERFIENTVRTCNESCYSGCAACCSQGTANRAASDVKLQA